MRRLQRSSLIIVAHLVEFLVADGSLAYGQELVRGLDGGPKRARAVMSVRHKLRL